MNAETAKFRADLEKMRTDKQLQLSDADRRACRPCRPSPVAA